MSPIDPPLLSVEGLHVRRGADDVLAEVTFELARGEIVALVGPSGVGKSTLLMALADLLPRQAGQLRLQGRVSTTLTAAERAACLAYLPQAPTVALGHTVLGLVLLGRARHRTTFFDRPEDLEAAALALEAAGASHLKTRLVDTLSGGERQRVFLARAYAQDTPLLLLDEPTTGLDAGQAIAVLENLSARTAQSAALLVMHDLNLAAQFATRGIVLSAGRIVMDGPPEVALAPDVLREVFGLESGRVPHPRAHVSGLIPWRGA
ncbi:MAG: ABC transporter ATP-binding protein [Myxococcales bacterium]|nr:ABC transporter ATP-binding protein [Myxococcales bacterium]